MANASRLQISEANSAVPTAQQHGGQSRSSPPPPCSDSAWRCYSCEAGAMTDLTIPAHGGQLRTIAERFGVPVESLLDFSASINPVPPSDELVAALCTSIRVRRIVTNYPDTNYTALKNAIA